MKEWRREKQKTERKKSKKNENPPHKPTPPPPKPPRPTSTDLDQNLPLPHLRHALFPQIHILRRALIVADEHAFHLLRDGVRLARGGGGGGGGHGSTEGVGVGVGVCRRRDGCTDEGS